VADRSPWYLAYRRLRANRFALAFLGLFVAIVLFVLAAPLWADHVAHTGPNKTHTTEKIDVDGERREVVSPDGIPIGPVWLGASGRFFLGADGRLGRDEMVRLMYGGRTSLTIGLGATLITTLLALVLALLAGYYRGWTDTVVSWALDILWAFPVMLLGIALGTALAISGVEIGPVTISSGSTLLPLLIIGFVLTPYMARPLRGEVLALREREFVEAAIAGGSGPLRVMLGELLPNLLPTAIVLGTLNVVNAMLLEAGLSFLGAGVQEPNSSWGSMIADGVDVLATTPLLTILPGAMIFLTVLAVNIFGDGLRDAIDPRSKVRLEAHTGSYEPERGSV
jgi:peptide/nickel transport system permease protein